MDQLTSKMAGAAVTSPEEKKEKPGSKPLAVKVPGGTEGMKQTIVTSMRPVSLDPNQAIFKYDVKIVYVYKSSDGTERPIEVSKSVAKGTRHIQDIKKCLEVFKMAAQHAPPMKSAGTTFYDRQASLYALKPLTLNGDIKLSFTKGLSDSPVFLRADFEVKAVAESFQATTNDLKNICNTRPALADKTLLEALNIIVSMPAVENQNVVTVGNCVHYLIDAGRIRGFQEQEINGNYTAVGVSKGIKCLEGTNKAPSLFMNTEFKVSMFHSNNECLIDSMRSKRGFRDNLQANSPDGRRIGALFIGSEFYCCYGPYGHLKDGRMIVKVKGFAGSARETTFQMDGKSVTVERYFQTKYNTRLNYPNLMLAVGRGKDGGKAYFPVELLETCEDQKLTTEQQNGEEEKSALVKAGAAPAHVRKVTTEEVAKEVGIASKNIGGFIQIGEPQKVQAYKRPPPTITFKEGQGLFNPASKFPTDFQKSGKYVDAKPLRNWEICFFDEREQAGNFPGQMINEMKQNGMNVADPKITYLREERNLEKVFKDAKSAKRELIFFIFRKRIALHKSIKSFEQIYDLLTQEVTLENASKCGRQTLQNIVNKTNMKLGGLNFTVSTTSALDDRFRKALIIGFETSRGGGGDYPICVGFAANMLDHPLKFSGGYYYVPQGPDVYGSIIEKALATVFKTAKETGRTAPPAELIIYFNGVTEGQYALINEVYVDKIKKACGTLSATFRPQLTIIATSKSHNERFYVDNGKEVTNISPGTFINSTVISPVFSEFYLASAIARKGTSKAAKYTMVYWSHPDPTLQRIETVTGQLCYLHEIVFQPISLPAPLYIAGRCSQRGAAILGVRGVISNANGEPDYEKMSNEYGYSSKNLGKTRYNA